MSQQNFESQDEKLRQSMLKANLEAFQENKLQLSLMLWEMSELYLKHNDGLDDQFVDEFQLNCHTLRQLLRYM